ncbi:EAL domain-containing protein [Actinoplanes sp. NPDC051851]|uniref:EAL domain-containing protein n=1 Tax=Actinoplanes sp. NPDC051851 TaxID=3154753 RepID=UPI003447383C
MSLAEVFPPPEERPESLRDPHESFTLFLSGNYSRILLFLLRQCLDRTLAEEALHEALIVALDKWPIVERHQRPLYWVRRTAWHKLLKSQGPSGWPGGGYEAEDALRQLPYRQRAVLALMLEDDNDQQIALQLGLAVTTVATYRAEVRRKAADLLDRAGRDAPTELEWARARRAMGRIAEDHQRRLAEGPEIISDVDLADPLLGGALPGAEARRIARAAELTKRGSLTWDAAEGRLDWSDEASRIFGLAPVEARRTLKQLFGLIHPGHRSVVRRLVRAAWRSRGATELICRITRQDGQARYVEVLLEVPTDEAGTPTGLVVTGQDVTAVHKERQAAQRRALRAASVRPDLSEVDGVTGLLTRRAFADEVGRALRTGTGTLLVISAPPYIRRRPDQDSGQHDRLSAEAGAILREIAGSDPCGRLDQHEYGVLMPYTTPETAVTRAGAMVSSLRGTRLDAFGGLVPYDHRRPLESMELLLDAESAWRRAKRDEGLLEVLHQPRSAEERRETCRAGIRDAVARDRFALFAQPLRDLELNQITRHEILLRVLDDVGRPTPPTTFLQIAEYVDEILAVDKWVIDNALRMIGEGSQTSHYQVNLSGRSLADPLLLEHLRDAITRFGVDPEHLTIEITETTAIGNLAVARRFADGIRELGCQLALDDFGTGSTPLSFLTDLPVDLVKIDGSFVHDLPESEPHQAIVPALVEICRKLGILTAAEYVRDDATLDLLRKYGVDFAQGFHVGQPERLVVGPRRSRSIELEIYPPT